MDLALASRIVGIVLTPSNFLLFLLIVGAVLQSTRRYQRWGNGLIISTAIICLLVLFFPIDEWLAGPLEDRFLRPAWPAHVDGVLVLGGGENGAVFATRGLASLNPAEGQLVAAAELARRYQNAKLIFSGGMAPLAQGNISEATVARAEFEEIGLPASRLILERHSQNTWENFLYSKELAHPKVGETWLIVTAAIKMPRAMGIAARLHWQALPWPADYITTGKTEGMSWNSSLAARLSTVEYAVHEWAGLLAYKLLGRLGDTSKS